MSGMTPEPPMMRPLPRTVRPFPDEYTGSYTRRLEEANGLPDGFLEIVVCSCSFPEQKALSILSGYSERTLGQAFPEYRCRIAGKRPYPAIRPAGYPRVQGPCPRCEARRAPGQLVVIWANDIRSVCNKHGLWTGNGAWPVPLDAQSDVVSAQHQLRALASTYGEPETQESFDDADHIVEQWQTLGVAAGVKDRLGRLPQVPEPAAKGGHARWTTVNAIARYPSAVALTALLLDPQWTKVIRETRNWSAVRPTFADLVTERYIPTGMNDPLIQWRQNGRKRPRSD